MIKLIKTVLAVIVTVNVVFNGSAQQSSGFDGFSSLSLFNQIESTSGSLPDRTARPPINSLRLAGEVMAGALGGLVGGFGASYIYFNIGNADCDGIFGCPSSIITFGAGIVVGSAVGVYAVGNIGNQTGSFLYTLAGSTVGLAIGAITISMTERGEFLLVAAIIGPVLAFNSTRRYKNYESVEDGFISLYDGTFSLSMPPVITSYNNFGGWHLKTNILRIYL